MFNGSCHFNREMQKIPIGFCFRYRKKVQQMRNVNGTKLAAETKRLNGNHKNKHGTTREPLLGGIASDYDLDLFRRAQVTAVLKHLHYLHN